MKKFIYAFCLGITLVLSNIDVKAESETKVNKTDKSKRKYKGYINAPDFPKGFDWLNTDKPISLKQLKGKFVIIDFWTYACINCMHIIPDLKKLENKYKNELVVIGVHSAKFNTEKETDNIRNAVLRYEIHHPVVNDKDFKIWNEYTAQAWPTIVVINTEGKIIEEYTGEGFYKDLDIKLGEAIKEAEEYNLLNKEPLKFSLEKNKENSKQLSFPGKVFADEKSQTLFISDSNHNRIIVMDLKNNEIKEIIGKGGIGLKDGDFSEAKFNHPQGIYLKDNILYIADTENHAIRAANLKSKYVKTIAGTGNQAGWQAKGGNAIESDLNSPWDITGIDDKLFIAMAGSHQLWEYDIHGQVILPYAGTGGENIRDGKRLNANLAQPSGITKDRDNLYFADSEVSAIRKLSLKNEIVSTITGEGLFVFGDKDGVGKDAKLQHPLGIVYNKEKLYITDTYNNKIKEIDINTENIKTLVGTGKEGVKDGNALVAQLNEPGGITYYDNKLYIADTNNNTIRVFSLKNNQLATLRFKNPEQLTKITEYHYKKN